jgi:hypothetical protein
MGKGKRKPLRGGQDAVKSARRSEGEESKADREESDSSGSDESDGEIQLGKKSGQESLDVTFEFNDMREEYSYGIAKMLQFIIAHPRDAQDAAEVVAVQGLCINDYLHCCNALLEEVGTAILCEEGEDVFGFATIVPLSTVQVSDHFQEQASPTYTWRYIATVGFQQSPQKCAGGSGGMHRQRGGQWGGGGGAEARTGGRQHRSGL